jgi:20S proteasome subunit beta 1
MVDDYITTTTTRMITSKTDGKEQTKKQRITVVSSTRSRQQQQQRINNPTASTASTASTCVICRSGSAADTQTLTSMVQCELLSRQVLHNVHGTVTHAASLLHTLLLNDNDSSSSGMSASLICTGYDHELHRGIIYTINKGGLLFEETYYSCLGSGSTYIIGHLDSYYNNRRRLWRLNRRQRLENNNNNTIIKDTTNTVYNNDNNDDENNDEDHDSLLLPTEQEAIELVYTSIQLAMERDGSSGGFIRLYVIDKFGKRIVTTRMIDDANNSNDDSHGVIVKTDDDDRRRRQEGVTLRDFAPAISPLDF